MTPALYYEPRSVDAPALGIRRSGRVPLGLLAHLGTVEMSSGSCPRAAVR